MPEKHCWQGAHTQGMDYAQMAAELETDIAVYKKILEKAGRTKHLGAQQARNKAEIEEMLCEMVMHQRHFKKKASEQADEA